MQIQTTIQNPKVFDIRDIPGFDGPSLYIGGGATFNFEKRDDALRLKQVLDGYFQAFYEAEMHRQAEADIDDEASRDGDRNHELTGAFGGVVV